MAKILTAEQCTDVGKLLSNYRDALMVDTNSYTANEVSRLADIITELLSTIAAYRPVVEAAVELDKWAFGTGLISEFEVARLKLQRAVAALREKEGKCGI